MPVLIEKALTLTQPWALLVALGLKPIENRKWNVKFRGRFYIHTSAKMPRKYYEEVRSFCWLQHNLVIPPPDDKSYHLGSIIASVELIDVLPRGAPAPWKFTEQYGYVLKDVKLTKVVPCKGALNFWKVKPEIQAQLRA